MQCRTDGHGGHCARCQNANVSCNYSEPGRPGRPVTRSGDMTNLNRAAAGSAVPSMPTPTSSLTPTSEGIWGQTDPTVYGVVKDSTYVGEDHIGTCTRTGPLDSFPGSEYLHLGTMGCLGPSDWLRSVSESEARPPSTADDNQQTYRGPQNETAITADPAFPSAISKAMTTSPVDSQLHGAPRALAAETGSQDESCDAPRARAA